jgi:23S rRNA (adenine-N6)-dimethyltransferase
LRRRLYSPNFLAKRKLAYKLVSNSSIGNNDLVIEIGPGKGRLTEALCIQSGRVIAVEINTGFCGLLRERFRQSANLEIICQDFLKFNLPKRSYKVFANIPFAITADIIRKLTNDIYLNEAYLIVQSEAAKKFVGIPFAARDSMMALKLKRKFNMDVVWKFRRYDFEPLPRVDCVLMRIRRRRLGFQYAG